MEEILKQVKFSRLYLKMVESVTQFAIVFLINAIVFLVLFCCFSVYRKKRTAPVDRTNAGDIELPPSPLYEESTYEKLGDLLKTINNTKDDTIAENVGVEALMYLKLERLIASMLNVFGLIGAVVLIPVYFLGEETDTIMLNMTIGNIKGHPILGIAPLVILVLFSAIAYYLIYKYIQDIKRWSSVVYDPKEKASASVLELYGCPAGAQVTAIYTEAHQMLTEKFGNDIKEVIVIPDYADAYAHMKKREELQHKLDHYKALNEKKGDNVLLATKALCCNKLDAVQHIESLIQDETDGFTKERAQKEGISTSVIYVICKNEERMAHIRDHVTDLEFTWGKVQSTQAPSTKNIKWENLGSNRRASMMKGCCFTVVFFFVAFFLFTPTSFINMVASLLPSFVGDIVGKYLPSLLFIVYMSVLIPMIIRFLVKTERHHTVGSAENSTMNKFLLFFSMNVFLFPTVVTPIIDTLIYGADFGSDFAHAVADMGNFFLVYITTMVFIQNGFNLLQAGRLIVTKLKERDATTRREEILAWSNEPFDVSYNSATHLTIMIIAFSYVITVPLCCIMGALYYNLRYFIDKYNVCCLFYVDFESRGETPKAALRFVILSVMMF